VSFAVGDDPGTPAFRSTATFSLMRLFGFLAGSPGFGAAASGGGI
jgi:hypothetical protein